MKLCTAAPACPLTSDQIHACAPDLICDQQTGGFVLLSGWFSHMQFLNSGKFFRANLGHTVAGVLGIFSNRGGVLKIYNF